MEVRDGSNMKIKTAQKDKEKPAKVPKPPKITDSVVIKLPVSDIKRLSVRVFEDAEFTKELPGMVTEMIHHDKDLILHLDTILIGTNSVWLVVTTEGHIMTMEVENDD